MKKRFSGFFLCLILSVSCGGQFSEIQRFSINKETLTVGIMSDLQIPENAADDNLYVANTKKALEYFRSQNIDILINAGDLTDLSANSSYDPYSQLIQTVFADKRPVTVQVMGNHDYWNSYGKAETLQKLRNRFQEMAGDAPWSHKTVNGYHFLAISPVNGAMDGSYALIEDKIRAEIETAVAENPKNPVFVVTHQHPEDTIYGSDDWGNAALTKIFADYPQIVSFSGHSHYSLLDERSVWQGSFTAFNTQCVSYVELEKGKENGSIPPCAEDSPMVMIMEISSDELKIRRYNLAEEREEKSPWIISLPLTPSEFRYTTEKRLAAATAPVFPESATASGVKPTTVKTDGKSVAGFTFTAAEHPDFVHSYEAEFSGNGQTITAAFFSDFCAGLDKMSPNPSFAVPAALKPGEYDVKITAVESFGKKSANQVTGKLTVGR